MADNWVEVAAIAAATDTSMAQAVERDGSQVQVAIDGRISDVAVEIISDDPTLGAAAAAVVGEALGDAGIVRFVDPGVPSQKTPGSGVAFAVVGDDGHFLPHTIAWLAATLGGGTGGGSLGGGYDIIVVSGQSNSDKADYLEVPGLREEDSRLFAWNGTTIVPLAATDVSLGAEFARGYLRDVAKTGRRVLVVFNGIGSVGFTTTSINPAPEGFYYHPSGTLDRTLTADPLNRYALMIARVNAARGVAGTGSRIAAMVWSQGESDKRLTEAGYAAKLDDLIASARTAWSSPDMPVVIGSMTPEMHSDHPETEQIARALADTPRRVFRTGFVWGPANGHRYYQTVHYSHAGMIDRAARMAREGLTEALCNIATVQPVPPVNLRILRSGGTATVEWDRPICHVDSLAVTYSTDGGTTWSPATIDTMHGSRATAAVAAGTAVQFQVVATNPIGASMPAIAKG
jgi:hypothetical protein